MDKDKLKNLKYLIPGIFAILFVIGLFILIKNYQQGLRSLEYRFWGAFSLTMLVFILVNYEILDLVEKRKKSAQEEGNSQEIEDLKERKINIYKLPSIGFKMGIFLLIIITYIYFLAPIEVLEFIFSLNSPIFITLLILVVIIFSIIMTGFLFRALSPKKVIVLPKTFLLVDGEIKEILIKGTGIKSDPAIIEPTGDKPKHLLHLNKSDFFVIIRNCRVERLLLDSCKNVRVDNCDIWSFAIQHSSEIYVRKTTMRRALKLWWSDNIRIEDCDINRIKFTQANSNNINNSSIKKIKYIYGANNTFKVNQIPDDELLKIKNKSWFKKGNIMIS